MHTHTHMHFVTKYAHVHMAEDTGTYNTRNGVIYKSDQSTLYKNTSLTYCPCIQCVMLARDCCFSTEKCHLSEARRSSPNHKLSGRASVNTVQAIMLFIH